MTDRKPGTGGSDAPLSISAAATQPGLHATRARLHRVARFLDSGIAVPGTSWRIGVEALIGLIPGIGDLAGALLGSYFVVEALRVRAPRGTIGRMVGNILLDLLLGLVPVAGDIADFAFKSNQRNLRLLDRHLDDRLGLARRAARRGRGGWMALALLVLALLAVLAWRAAGGFTG
ncbi:MAG: DUF4112 domain-containing protein [Solimonas sp.]